MGPDADDGRFLKRVTIDITNRCNLRCVMCPQHLMDMPRFDMPLETYRRIAEGVLPHTRELFFSCAFEAMLAESFAGILEITRRFAVPEYALISNGTLLDERNAERVIDSGMNTLIVSMDGATKDTYERIRQGASHERLLRNLERFADVKRRRDTEFPRVNLTYTLMKSNIREMPLLVGLAARLGVGSVNFKPVQIHMDAMRGEALSPEDAPLITESLEAALDAGRSYGVDVTAAPEMDRYRVGAGGGDREPAEAGPGPEQATSPRRCVEPYPSLYIRAGGEVYPCTIWRDEPLGNFNAQDFREIWEGPEFTALRRELTTGDFRPGCDTCCYVM